MTTFEFEVGLAKESAQAPVVDMFVAGVPTLILDP